MERMKELDYPFDCGLILSRRRSLKKRLLKEIAGAGKGTLRKRVAILGGSTTADVRDCLELFLLNEGIEAEFYESEYGRYFEDAMFPNPGLEAFRPDVVYVHTSSRNILEWPEVGDSEGEVGDRLEACYRHFEAVWERIEALYRCPVIQNNMELPPYRLLGNMDASDCHGRVNFTGRLNAKFYEYARGHGNFHINDINWLSACYGLDRWADPSYWHMYKYALCVPAIPVLAASVANIIKALYGKNRKAFVLDLDNTLWGGVVGDDGAENLEVGQETPLGQAYSEFQAYLKGHKDMGVLLNVCSKNEEGNALAGLGRPGGVLRPEDFIVIKANWEPKSRNIEQTARELNIGADSLVFVDDSPAEREIVRQQLGMVAVPEVSTVENYIREIDRHGYFEAVGLSGDDLGRSRMYRANAERAREEACFGDYGDYLLSLRMRAVIRPFEPAYMARIAQLTNKSNQFNLTTRRYTQAEVEAAAADAGRVTLYGKLEDRFGDNGVVSVLIGRLEGDVCHMELWLMSCRVLKRGMESAMMDTLVHLLEGRGIKEIRGYYYPTAKNAMVKEFYGEQGFSKAGGDGSGGTVWSFRLPDSYEDRNKAIRVEG